MSEDRFCSPAPVFQPSLNPNAIEATTPKEQDHTPSQSMSERLREQGQDYLAELLEKSRQLASTLETQLPNKGASPKKRSTPKNDHTQTVAVKCDPITFTAEDIVSDEEFIKRTRGYIRMQREHSGSIEIVSRYEGFNIHSLEARRLFLANGGERHLISGIDYPMAFENLRREKLQALTRPVGKANIQPLRVVKLPGMPSQREWKARQEAERVREARKKLGFRDDENS